MNSEPKLGELIKSFFAPRDAIHVAIVSVSSDEVLKPGQHVSLIPNSRNKVTFNGVPIGIVDPFLLDEIQPGEQFWLILYPKSITGIRHHWEHPMFESETSKEYLKQVAHEVGVSYDDLIEVVKRKDYKGSFGVDINYTQIEPEFWEHLKRAEGIDVPLNERIESFRCAC